MADKDTVMETEEKEVVSRNFIEQEIDKDLAEAFMTMSRPVSRRSQTVICTSDMPSPSY